MAEWQPIETAPKDGTIVFAGKKSRWEIMPFPYAVKSRYLDGRWKAEFRDGEWASYDPQPTHWRPHALPSS